ncbi:ankyrin repeat and SOCS box protein 3 isoform 2-T2 [Synchiropus picturatus]
MDFTECYQDTVSSVAAAARSGNRAHLQQLIRRGFSVETRDNRGWSPLHEAAAAGSVVCVRDILSAAAGDTSTPPRHFVNSQTHEGESACFLAARHGHVDVVKLLLRAQSDIDQLTNDLSCPLYTAVDSGHLNVVRLLIRRGAQVNRTHTESCWTCLHQAVYKGHSGIVRLLVKVCHLEARDDHEITPLFVAAQYGRQECLEILIKSGADVNAQAADLATPLMIASQEGHSACVDLLLDQGADPNLACSLDWPQLPIHVAAQCGHHRLKQVDGEVLNLLLEFVNWSTMSAHLTHILSERRQEQSWIPSPYYDSPPPLLHLCRLQLRAVFGASILMRSSVVQQLPVPSLLHSYLQFNDILSSFPSPLTPSTHL